MVHPHFYSGEEGMAAPVPPVSDVSGILCTHAAEANDDCGTVVVLTIRMVQTDVQLRISNLYTVNVKYYRKIGNCIFWLIK